MDVLFYRYGSICEPDIIEAFKHLDLDVDEYATEICREDIMPGKSVQAILERLRRKKYFFVFSINFFPYISEVCNICEIPYLCLITDSVAPELFSGSIKNKCNRIFIFDRRQYNDFHFQNPDCIFHLPPATNMAKNYAICTNASSTRREHFSCDISFIGSLYTEKCKYNAITLPDNYRGYVDALIEAQLLVYGYNFVEECVTPGLIDAFISAQPDIFNTPGTTHIDMKSVIAQQYINVKVTEQERIRLLTALSERFDVDLYTLSDTSMMPKIHNRGSADFVTEMPVIFNRSKINLNITAKSTRSGLSHRVFDVLGCEGFLITNYQEELPEHFIIGEDLEVYSDPDDLMDKCEYYLAHEKDRREIARNGLEKIRQYHTYDIRMAQMIQIAFNL